MEKKFEVDIALYKENLLNRYKDRVLGITSLATESDYMLDDFLNTKILIDFIVRACDSETFFTKAGFAFLEEYYGIDYILEKILIDYPEYPFDGSRVTEVLFRKRIKIVDG